MSKCASLSDRILAVEVDEANATLNNDWNLLSRSLDERSPAVNKTTRKKKKVQEVKKARIHLDEGEHVSTEEFVVVNQVAARVILLEAQSLAAEPAQFDNTNVNPSELHNSKRDGTNSHVPLLASVWRFS